MNSLEVVQEFSHEENPTFRVVVNQDRNNDNNDKKTSCRSSRDNGNVEEIKREINETPIDIPKLSSACELSVEQEKSVRMLMKKVAKSVKSRLLHSATPTELYTSLRSSVLNQDSVASELDYNMENASFDSLHVAIDRAIKDTSFKDKKTNKN